MQVTLPFYNNQYATLITLLAQQSPEKVLESIPGVGVGAKTAQQAQSVWENGLPKTGNPLVDSLVVNNVNDTVGTAKQSIKSTKHLAWKGFWVGGLTGIIVQLVGFTGPKFIRGLRAALRSGPSLPWKTATKQAFTLVWKAIQAGGRGLSKRNIFLGLLGWGGLGAAVGLGAGVTLGVLRSIGRFKNLIWGKLSPNS